MTLQRWIRRTAIVGLTAIALVLSGCGLFKAEETDGQIDPPQLEYDLDAELGIDQLDHEVMAQVGKEAPVTLYFKDPNGYVAPVGMRIPFQEDIGKLALTYMTDGGPADEMLPEGFTALIPQGTKVLAMDIREGLATVDFSEDFTDYNPQDERKILEAVTWALTGFNSIDRVQFWVAGKPLKQMPKDSTPLDEPLSRVMGINLEIGEDVNPSVASAVTLYFQGQAGGDYPYYVPVTRLIRHTEDMTLAAVEELVEGPSSRSGLYAVLSSGTEVLNVSLNKDTVVVNFADNPNEDDAQLSKAAVEAVILSLTEQTGLSKVQIMVDGKAGIKVGSKTEFASPVTRPAQLNPVKL